MPSSSSSKPPRSAKALGVQVLGGGAAGELVVVLRYAYSGKLPSERQRANMARDLLAEALSRLDDPLNPIVFTGFREDALKRVRNDEFHLDHAPDISSHNATLRPAREP